MTDTHKEAQSLKPGEWQPIKTYEGCGVVLVSRPTNHLTYTPTTAFRDAVGIWRVFRSEAGMTPLPFKPTHWMPLPVAPSTPEPTPQPTQPSDWIPHDGGPMPVDGEKWHDLEFRDGEIKTNVRPRGWKIFFDWGRGGGSNPDFDIIAYRLSKGEPS